MSSRRMAAVGVLAIAIVLGGGQAATASQGSVPAEVSAYANDPDGLLARLDDLAGIGANGQGIDFDGAKVGQLNRIFEFTPAFAAGERTETPVERANEWTAPIIRGDKPLGVAVIWISQSTVEPELADFTEGATFGAAVMDVPADAALVRDAPRAAWFTLVGEELTPLAPGSSGVDGPTALAEYQDVLAAPPTSAPEPSGASELSIVVIVLSILVILAVLLVPMVRERSRAREAAATARATESGVAAEAKAPTAKPTTGTAVTRSAKTSKPALTAKSPAAKRVSEGVSAE